jgi:dipeptidyl aminopeptidase/acylaminoacyl peptidase
VQRIKTTAGAVMVVPSSLIPLEQSTMKQRAAGGAISVPIFTTSGGATATVSLTPAGDSIVATVGNQEYRLKVDQAGHILGGAAPSIGLSISRVDAATAARLALGKPDYSAPAGAPYTAVEISLPGPAGTKLGGTLTLPSSKSPVPAVVTITGSGQQDRDEYIPVAGGYRPFRQIADTLTRRGIAVLRLDDRGIGASNGNPYTSSSSDFADDIRAAVAYLRTRRDIDPSRIALLGHSEGAMIAPMVAVNDKRLKGLVLLAGPADNGREIIRYQQRYAVDQDTSLSAAKRDSVYGAAQTHLDSMAAKNSWMHFFLSYAPEPTARKVRVPVLILQGANDRQVPAQQAEKLAAAFRAGGNQDVTVHVFPGRNHLFIVDPVGNPQEYGRLAMNKIDAEVLGVVADWLADKLRGDDH